MAALKAAGIQGRVTEQSGYTDTLLETTHFDVGGFSCSGMSSDTPMVSRCELEGGKLLTSAPEKAATFLTAVGLNPAFGGMGTWAASGDLMCVQVKLMGNPPTPPGFESSCTVMPMQAIGYGQSN